jgi:hypothetical protein
MTNAIVTINGNHSTVLGQGQMRIPTGGKIRAGIKVLTKKAAENPQAKDIYERGVSENNSFEEIERAIQQDVSPDLQYDEPIDPILPFPEGSSNWSSE